MRKALWKRGGYFDVWFPVVAPSERLLRSIRHKDLADAKTRTAFFDAYRRELARPPASHAVALLAEIAATTRIAVGCYCEDETRCHRAVLREVIAAQTRSS